MGAAPHLESRGIWDIFDLSLLSDSDLGSYLDQTLERCAEWFHASGGSIFLYDGDGAYLLRSRYGTSLATPENAEIVPGEGVGGIVAASGVGRILDDLDDPDFEGVARNERIGSSMVLPLVDPRGNSIGVFNLSRRCGEASFTPEDLKEATALAAHVALALANGSMVSALKGQIEHAEDVSRKLKGVLDSVAGAVLVVDEDGEVVNHNERAAKVSYLTMEEGVDLSQLQAALMESIWDVLKTGSEANRRAFDPVSDRTWFVEAVPIETGGAVITVSEITEHEREQREMSRVKRLAEIGQMTAAVAHEIRNPLTGIRSAAQMIREDHSLASEFIGMVEEEAVKLNNLCDEFLSFSRPAKINEVETTLWDVVDSQIKLMEGPYSEKGVELRGLHSDKQPKISVDRDKIGQVVLNLMRNALEASESGQAVTVDVSPTRIVVEDAGCGISEEDQEKLFSPFFTTKSDGTGLGLCNARKIVDAHGGELTMTSEVGRGTRFEIVLDRRLA